MSLEALGSEHGSPKGFSKYEQSAINLSFSRSVGLRLRAGEARFERCVEFAFRSGTTDPLPIDWRRCNSHGAAGHRATTPGYAHGVVIEGRAGACVKKQSSGFDCTPDCLSFN